jgi:cytochrome P450
VSELSEFFKEKEPYIFKNTDVCPFLSKGTSMWPMYLNDEVHKITRTVMGKSLNLKNLDTVLAEFVGQVNHDYRGRKELDLVAYCSEYIFLVVREILGLETADNFDKIRQYSSSLAQSQDVYIPRQTYLEINSWLLRGREMIRQSGFEQRVAHHASQLGRSYTEEESYSITAIALMAAFETSKDNLSAALHCIMRDIELMDYILECSPDQLNLLIEEFFRFTSPLQYTVRVNKDALEFAETRIPPHSKLYLCLASANRDDRVFENPDDLMPNRTPNEHLSFGKGVHFCLGANIARQEMRLCLKPMVNFLKDYRIKGASQVKWSKQIFMRTIESVELESKTL